MAGIEASRDRSLARLLFGLNIRHLGGAVGEFLAGEFGHLDDIIAADVERLAEVPGVGPTIAASVRPSSTTKPTWLSSRSCAPPG